MSGNEGLLSAIRGILTQEASIPALRAGILLFALFAALAWSRRRPRFALVCLAMGAAFGLGYWLLQLRAPLGLATNAALTREWAQAGVNSAAEPGGMGFVMGTSPETSMIAMLARSGLPLPFVQAVPQITVMLCLGFLLVLPLGLIRNHTSGAFAAGLVIGGGLWPGMSAYGAVLRDPSGAAASVLVLGFLLIILGLGRGIRRRFHHSRLGFCVVLIALAALGRALAGGAESGITVALFLVTATVVLASPLRAFLRRISRGFVPARLAEGLVLLGTFAGGGLLWWNPVASVVGFAEARNEEVALRRPIEWISRNVPRSSVVLSSPAYSAHIAALAGRRVLFPPPSDTAPAPPLPEPYRRNRLFESTLQGRPVARLAEAFSATHLFLGPGEPTPPMGTGTEPEDEPRLRLVPVYEDARDFRVFLLARK